MAGHWPVGSEGPVEPAPGEPRADVDGGSRHLAVFQEVDIVARRDLIRVAEADEVVRPKESAREIVPSQKGFPAASLLAHVERNGSAASVCINV